VSRDRVVDEPGHGDVAEAARVARAVLAELADDESELTATAATRHRLEGAAIALETPAGSRVNERLRETLG
jgi:hypothetical protein